MASLCFLLIPSQVHSENAEGEIIFKPNPVRMAPKAVYFWSSAIVYGGFFLVAGATIASTSGIVSLISMGTGAGWLLGATILSLVSLFRMGISDDEHAATKTKLLVPSEDFAQLAGNPEIKGEMAQILYQVTNAQKTVGSVQNGILLTGSSGVGRTIFARALAGEY
ncbi:ATP-dependent Clp protease, partial [mine drainage metagenome]